MRNPSFSVRLSGPKHDTRKHGFSILNVGNDAAVDGWLTACFAWSTRYLLRYAGKIYPSKAILAVAHEYEFGHAMKPNELYGGHDTIQQLKKLGFDIVEISET